MQLERSRQNTPTYAPPGVDGNCLASKNEDASILLLGNKVLVHQHIATLNGALKKDAEPGIPVKAQTPCKIYGPDGNLYFFER